MSFVVVGPPQFGCFKVRDGMRVVKPHKEWFFDLLTACSGFDKSGEPLMATVIHGGLDEGSDRLVRSWAEKNMMEHIPVPCSTKSFGKHAVKHQADSIAALAPNYVICIKDKSNKVLVDDLAKRGIPVFFAAYDR